MGRVRKLVKHPHERGEDLFVLPSAPVSIETPPRAWGRLDDLSFAVDDLRKHPHERGEDLGEGRGEP